MNHFNFFPNLRLHNITLILFFMYTITFRNPAQGSQSDPPPPRGTGAGDSLCCEVRTEYTTQHNANVLRSSNLLQVFFKCFPGWTTVNLNF
jgi:hypothetical protein